MRCQHRQDCGAPRSARLARGAGSLLSPACIPRRSFLPLAVPGDLQGSAGRGKRAGCAQRWGFSRFIAGTGNGDILHSDILHSDILHSDIPHSDILHSDIPPQPFSGGTERGRSPSSPAVPACLSLSIPLCERLWSLCALCTSGVAADSSYKARRDSQEFGVFRNACFAVVISLLMAGLGMESGILAVPGHTQPGRVLSPWCQVWGLGSALLSLM